MFNPTLVDPRRYPSDVVLDRPAGIGTNYGIQEPFDPYDRSQPLSGLFASGPGAGASSNIARLKTPRR